MQQKGRARQAQQDSMQHNGQSSTGQKSSSKKEEKKLENMDFFALLQATGFVKKEHSKDLKTTATGLVKLQGPSGAGGALPMLREHMENKDKPWRMAKVQKLTENLDILSESDE
jgi:hypothetical protein